MRALIRVNGEWESHDPQDLAAWMWEHQSEDACVIDGPTFYCALPSTLARNRESGKDARPFSELYRRLPVAAVDNPLACGDGVGEGVAVCSERQSCQGKQLHCGGRL